MVPVNDFMFGASTKSLTARLLGEHPVNRTLHTSCVGSQVAVAPFSSKVAVKPEKLTVIPVGMMSAGEPLQLVVSPAQTAFEPTML